MSTSIKTQNISHSDRTSGGLESNLAFQGALDSAEMGWFVIPLYEPISETECSCSDGKDCISIGKHPRTFTGLKDASNDPQVIKDWWDRWPNANYGIVTGAQSGIVVLDIDGDEGRASLKKFTDAYGPIITIEASTGGDGNHCIFAHPGTVLRNSAGKLGKGLDIRGDGGYICGVGSIHASGKRYTWNTPPDVIEPAPIPDWMLQILNAPKSPKSISTDHGDNGRHWLGKALAKAQIGTRNETGLWLACQLRDAGLSATAAESVILEYADRVPMGDSAYSVDEAIASLKSAYNEPAREPAKQDTAGKPADELHTAAKRTTDVGNSARFVLRNRDSLRFCKAWGKWLVWTGKRWEPDDKLHVVKLAKQTALSIYDEVKAEVGAAKAGGDDADKHRANVASLMKWAVASQKQSSINAMLELAKPDLAISPDELDADSSSLNCQNGTIDLKTGALRPHRQEDYLTKLCRASYSASAPAPTFQKFMGRIFRTYPGLIPYMQKVLGYGCTGLTSEQALFFLYGLGSNGKTTLLDAVQHAMGDYAGKADRDLLTSQNAHPTNVADLMGRRLVVCSETNETCRIDEAKLKDLVGETRLKARYMRCDFFEFTASHKIFLYSNHKPVVRGTDFGLWRRMRLVPFIETIGNDEKDQQLSGKLQAEADGILSWLVAGAVRWHQEGLGTPVEVAQATDLYRTEMDSIGTFLADCTFKGETMQAMAGDLYTAYANWCRDAGEKPLSQKRLGTQLAERGYLSRRCTSSNRKLWAGIGLKVDPDGEPFRKGSEDGSESINAS